ncbi:hypothetical protein GALL_205990 [mine drainage metagenome]|uniref:Cytochrome c domain-containing protein n=1 Tax=mine drainage metagenome TaxID=410659 RepID=A0A1J5SAU5_9ZZZZ
MKKIIFLLLMVSIVACNTKTENEKKLQSRIDSLEIKLNNSYKPGLGEFMSSIQIHHAKLWFAGQNKNWDLADFEIKEIKEALDNINKYCTDRPEIKALGMIDEPVDSISKAIQDKDFAAFKNNFVVLTNTCTNCHRETNHGFNVLKIPDNPPFSDQDFKLPAKN